MEIKAGLEGRAQEKVTAAVTAKAVGSGSLAVYATPAMCALMEKAACAAIDDLLQEGESSVGTLLEIVHERASAPCSLITAVARLTEVKGRALSFAVEAADEKGPIGRGRHQRVIVNVEKFLARLS